MDFLTKLIELFNLFKKKKKPAPKPEPAKPEPQKPADYEAVKALKWTQIGDEGNIEKNILQEHGSIYQLYWLKGVKLNPENCFKVIAELPIKYQVTGMHSNGSISWSPAIPPMFKDERTGIISIFDKDGNLMQTEDVAGSSGFMDDRFKYVINNGGVKALLVEVADRELIARSELKIN